MPAFNATLSPISNVFLTQSVTAQATVAAADAASVGSYNVVFMVQTLAADGTWPEWFETIIGVEALTQTPSPFSISFTPPSTGSYRVLMSVRDTSWHWETVNQTPASFTVGPVPAIYAPLTTPPADAGVVPIIKQADGSYLPSIGSWQMIPGMSIVDSSVLDTTKWLRRYWQSYGAGVDHLNDELERYVDSAVTYDTALRLTATPQAGTTGHAPSASGIQYPNFTSGMVRSVETAQFFFSHLQIVLPCNPDGSPILGVWPAWWIIPGDGKLDPNPEMDMLEFVVNGVSEHPSMIHCNCSANKALIWHDASYNKQWGFLQPPAAYGANYWLGRPVDICILWSEDNTMTIYHDGNPTAKWVFPWHYQDAFALPATMMINFAIGGSWPTNGFTTAVPTGPVTTTVNFLKTYQRLVTVFGPPSPT